MGPVMVVIDEADAALGDRDTEGDSGTSSRVFGMIATQMGDTRYRGKILWMLLTARPDLLPIDIKRQGRAEVHIPLFYPYEDDELRQMFVMLAKKLGTTLERGGRAADAAEGAAVRRGHRGHRRSRAGGSRCSPARQSITREALAEVVAQFLPSTQGLEKELQETAAIIECTDREFLPPPIVKEMEKAGGRGALQERLTALKQLVAAL